MVELLPNEFVDFFDGESALQSLLNPPKPVVRFISPVGDITHKPVDDTDLKLIGFLTGRKVYFTDEEIKRYIIE